MFILMAIIMMLVGIFLLIKAIKMPKGKGLNIVVGICAVTLFILGAILFGSLSNGVGKF